MHDKYLKNKLDTKHHTKITFYTSFTNVKHQPHYSSLYCLYSGTQYKLATVWKLLVGKPEGKRPVGRPRMRWENNINPLKPNLFFFSENEKKS